MFKEKIIEKITFKEICDDLDFREKEYLSGKMKTYTVEEVWEKIKNRKNTFLTSR